MRDAPDVGRITTSKIELRIASLDIVAVAVAAHSALGDARRGRINLLNRLRAMSAFLNTIVAGATGYGCRAIRIRSRSPYPVKTGRACLARRHVSASRKQALGGVAIRCNLNASNAGVPVGPDVIASMCQSTSM